MSCRLFIVAIAVQTAACTEIVGIENVSVGDGPMGDANSASCDVAASIGQVSSPPAVGSVAHRMSDGGPTLSIALNSEPSPDVLSLYLYENMGGHGTLNAPGTYALTPGDSQLSSCGTCVIVRANYNPANDTSSQTYMALAQGSLTLSRADAIRMTGKLQNLRLRRVELTGNTTRDINDGCTVTISEVKFDLAYSE